MTFLGLQWGHRLSVVETSAPPTLASSYSSLQWGHRLSVVETFRPRTDQLQLRSLQWGHRLSVVETGGGVGIVEPVDPTSMGPPPFGSGNSIMSRLTAVQSRLQWGHRLSVVETALYGSLTSRMHRTELFSARNGYRIKGVAGVATLVCRVLVEKLREVQHDSFTIGPLAG